MIVIWVFALYAVEVMLMFFIKNKKDVTNWYHKQNVPTGRWRLADVCDLPLSCWAVSDLEYII